MPANTSASNDITYIDWITQSNFWDYNTYINNDIKYIDWIPKHTSWIIVVNWKGQFNYIYEWNATEKYKQVENVLIEMIFPGVREPQNGVRL